jgi:hypothetical protein
MHKGGRGFLVLLTVPVQMGKGVTVLLTNVSWLRIVPGGMPAHLKKLPTKPCGSSAVVLGGPFSKSQAARRLAAMA